MLRLILFSCTDAEVMLHHYMKETPKIGKLFFSRERKIVVNWINSARTTSKVNYICISTTLCYPNTNRNDSIV
jgi:hypothetical protein